MIHLTLMAVDAIGLHDALDSACSVPPLFFNSHRHDDGDDDDDDPAEDVHAMSSHWAERIGTRE